MAYETGVMIVSLVLVCASVAVLEFTAIRIPVWMVRVGFLVLVALAVAMLCMLIANAFLFVLF